ncbi:hypothetical protein ABW19_dt0203285 [Dactylella cylindrospora]|nr:hypothetical protein ABW19_dt0203285 [Dactylella cylindrospora]
MATDEASDDLRNLRSIVRSNLEFQHYWTDVELLDTLGDIEGDLDVPGAAQALPRPLIYGRPSEQLYNPEPAASTNTEGASKPTPDMEYVLAVHLNESFTLRKWAAVFDAIPTPAEESNRKKRIVVGVVSGDSTVVYYIMHDGIVKPRQN